MVVDRTRKESALQVHATQICISQIRSSQIRAVESDIPQVGSA
jgi:hypothetical protein